MRHDPHRSAVALQRLDRLDHRLQRLLGVERAEALVDEQALPRLVAMGARAGVRQAPGGGSAPARATSGTSPRR
jgi:hypothetical protein